MMILKFRFAIVFSLIAIFIVACSPEDGDTGPVGPVGPPGPAGGSDVSVEAYIFTVDTADWTTNNKYQEVTLNVPEITSAVFNRGNVEVYQKSASDNSWQGMPYSNTIQLSQTEFANYFIRHSYAVGSVRIRAYLDVPAQLNFSEAMNFKVVIIPSTMRIEGVDYDNYEMVKTVYDL